MSLPAAGSGTVTPTPEWALAIAVAARLVIVVIVVSVAIAPVSTPGHAAEPAAEPTRSAPSLQVSNSVPTIQLGGATNHSAATVPDAPILAATETNTTKPSTTGSDTPTPGTNNTAEARSRDARSMDSSRDRSRDRSGNRSIPARSETSAAETASTALDLPSFRVIGDRNIFNADRIRRSPRSGGSGERPRQVQVDTISLVGYLGSAQGDRAFFDGNSSSYRKAIKVGDTLGDIKLKSLSDQNAVIEVGGKDVTIRIGEQLRREENGPWVLASGGITSSDATSSASSTGTPTDTDTLSGATSEEKPAPEGGGADDALQRLLKRRQQEENK